MLWEIGQDIDTAFNSVYATQIDTSDSYYEIVVAGVDFGTPDDATLSMFMWNGTAITVKASTSWRPGNGDANAAGVYAKTVDSDNDVEILTAGYYYSSGSQYAELRVWNYSDSSLNLEDDITWTGEGTAEALSVYAANVDTPSDIEIITCGNSVDPLTGAVYGDLETFTHSGTTITPDRHQRWRHSGADTECHSVYAGEVNESSPVDIITVGKTVISSIDNGQISMWNYGMGSDIDLEHSVQWYTTNDTEAHSVFVLDVDADDDVEILSGGQAFDRTRIRAQLRIWYWS